MAVPLALGLGRACVLSAPVAELMKIRSGYLCEPRLYGLVMPFAPGWAAGLGIKLRTGAALERCGARGIADYSENLQVRNKVVHRRGT